jgi:hypothetical protein
MEEFCWNTCALVDNIKTEVQEIGLKVWALHITRRTGISRELLWIWQ